MASPGIAQTRQDKPHGSRCSRKEALNTQRNIFGRIAEREHPVPHFHWSPCPSTTAVRLIGHPFLNAARDHIGAEAPDEAAVDLHPSDREGLPVGPQRAAD